MQHDFATATTSIAATCTSETEQATLCRSVNSVTSIKKGKEPASTIRLFAIHSQRHGLLSLQYWFWISSQSIAASRSTTGLEGTCLKKGTELETPALRFPHKNGFWGPSSTPRWNPRIQTKLDLSAPRPSFLSGRHIDTFEPSLSESYPVVCSPCPAQLLDPQTRRSSSLPIPPPGRLAFPIEGKGPLLPGRQPPVGVGRLLHSLESTANNDSWASSLVLAAPRWDSEVGHLNIVFRSPSQNRFRHLTPSFDTRHIYSKSKASIHLKSTHSAAHTLRCVR
ncbi:uncharacterized protein B0T15DRAFT_306732 [Chaetomium strumarium]|uniref:Uncharacterized protein n=1 Tax=Chaetomium strumarium TaxID=1170767 RepID=A0AAJ0GM35_9PEZI|nr:hypothetical protein B0T15DRAFT_306732 [Chaetomium strumarium]